ncbi:MAG: hypothetical protein K6E11_03790 [Bacilli bacterium]|nr:hypothetical protein [Bacilli bacterium]
MEYILFSFLALLASAGNTIFNRIGAKRASALLNATVKSFFIVIACFLICLAMGHVPTLYSWSSTDFIWLSVVGVLTAIDWLFYFFAIKRTHLEVFAPFTASGVLFTSNLLFLIFMFASVTNGGKPLNITFFIIGLLCMVGAMMFVIFNKKMNPSQKFIWIIYDVISVVAFAFLLLVVKMKLSHIPSDVISFHQMLITFVILFIAACASKTIVEIGKIRPLDHLYIFIGAVFNALMNIFRYQAFSYDTCIPAIVNVIVALDFIIVSAITVIFYKSKNKVALIIAISLIFTGMVLNLLAGLI